MEALSRNGTRPPADVAPPLPEGTLEALEDGLPVMYPEVAELHADAPLDSDTENGLAVFGSEDDELVQAPKRLSRDQIAWLATGFLTLILMGMAGAALVFFPRTADIIAVLR